MARVRTGSRLHFGLLSLADGDGPIRRFGGVGLMVEAPAVEVEAHPATTWSAHGPDAERALAFVCRTAERLQQERDQPIRPLRIEVIEAAPPHTGLGSGTQLALAAARAATSAWGVAGTVLDLARWTGRGLRSGLGVHGFAWGGLLVDGGKRSPDGVAPLIARIDFPTRWRIVLAIPEDSPSGAEGLHASEERTAFTQLATASRQHTDVLCRLVLLGLLPTALEQDLDAFGEALFEFNRRVGETFAPVQGGIYSSPAVAELVAWLRGRGVAGVSQSSWGPTVFAVVADEEQATDLAGRLQRSASRPVRVLVTRARNVGASTEVTRPPLGGG
jgi:beta-RFAP synthase